MANCVWEEDSRTKSLGLSPFVGRQQFYPLHLFLIRIPESIAPAMLLRSRLSSTRVLVPPVHRQLPFLLENHSCCLACFVLLGCCFSQWLSISLSEVVEYQILPQAFSLLVACDLKRYVTLNPKLYLMLCVQARKAVLQALCSGSC